MESIKITGLTNEFAGFGHTIAGKKIEIPFVLPGDEVEIENVKRRPKSRSHKVIKIQRNVEWNEVACQHFGECGGCVGQHLKYETQTNLKFSPILTLFADSYGILLNQIPATEIYHYRTRMDFSVFPGPKIGLRQRGNFRKIVPIEECKIQSKAANFTLTEVRRLIELIPQIIWDRQSEEGGLKYVTIRKAQNTEDQIVIFTFTEGFETNALHEKFIELSKEILRCESIVFCYNRKKSEVSAVGTLRNIRGNSFYEEILLDKKFQIPFDSFFQPNPNGFLPILKFIDDYMAKNSDTLVDLFCGSGFFSSLFGKDKKRIYGYEVTESSIDSAKKILGSLFPNQDLHFHVQNLFLSTDGLPKIADASLILDPPRSGAGPLLCEWLNEYGPSEIFYVSCNPYSQWEDIKRLNSKYDCIDGILTDPYPHTPHIESVLYFRRKS